MQETQVFEESFEDFKQASFSHISERVARIEADLEYHQYLLDDSRDDISLLNRANQLKLNLFNLKYAEKLFLLRSSSVISSRTVTEVQVSFML